MGLFDFLTGSGGEGYRSPNLGASDEATKSGVFNVVGAKKKKDGTYDYSGVGNPITGASGVQSSNEGYDFSGIDKAQAGYAAGPKPLTETYNPYQFKETYNSSYNPTAYKPTQFNYQTLPEQYFNQAYQSGAKDIRREGQGQLQQTQEGMGTRRPGLFLKAAQGNMRDVGERLAALNSNLGLKRMEQGVDLGVKQQQDQSGENRFAANFGEGQSQFGAGEGYREYGSKSDLEKNQAGENYKGYGSRADREDKNAQLIKDYLAGTLASGQTKLGGQQTGVKMAQDYQGSGLDRLINYFNSLKDSENTAAGIDTTKRGQTLGFIGNLAGAGAKAARGGA